MGIEREGTCVYCGTYGIVTADHVIPQCLWPASVPKDAPVVDACYHCNHVVKSAYDTNLRDLLLIDADSSQSPQAQLLYPKFVRAAGRNQSKMAKAMREHSQPAQLMLEPGVIATLGYTSPEANEQMPKILQMIVRGLFYHRTGRILPKDVVFAGLRERNHNRLEQNIQMCNETGADYMGIGDGSVFECRFALGETDPYNSAWILSFYKRAFFVMFTESLKMDAISIVV